jgi:hypothetical protein
MAAVLSQDKKEIFFFSPDIYDMVRITLDGKDERNLSRLELRDIEDIAWSPERDRAIIKAKKEGNSLFILFKVKDKKGLELKKGLDNAIWANLGDKIIYKFYSSTTKERSLNVANPDGSNWEKIADVAWRDISVQQVPQSSLVSYWNKPNAYEETALMTVGVMGGDTKKIFSGRFGADYLWSPSGEKILVSSSDEKGSSKMSLAVVNRNGGEYKNLDLPGLAFKCIWAKDNKNILCSVPENIPDGSVMPNDYQEKKFNTSDSLWKIDTDKGKKTKISDSDGLGGNFDAVNLILSPEEGTLYFINRADGKLYRISL